MGAVEFIYPQSPLAHGRAAEDGENGCRPEQAQENLKGVTKGEDMRSVLGALGDLGLRRRLLGHHGACVMKLSTWLRQCPCGSNETMMEVVGRGRAIERPRAGLALIHLIENRGWEMRQ